MSEDSNIDASEIDVKVEGTKIILSGSVDSKEIKRRAEDIAESVSGVSNVQNHSRVGSSSQSSQASTLSGNQADSICRYNRKAERRQAAT